MNAHQEVERLLDQIRAVASNPVVERASDRIQVLCSSYMEPTVIPGPWDNLAHFTNTEIRILDRLIQKPGQPVTMASLLNAMYFDRNGSEPSPEIIRVYMTNLRKKLAGSKYSIPVEKSYHSGYRIVIAS